MDRTNETLIVEVSIDGDPMSKSRPRFGKKGGRVYTPRKTKEAEEFIGWQIKSATPGLTVNPKDAFAVDLEFYCKSYHRRDIDNMIKLIFDACNQLVWRDDVQVERLAAQVIRASDNPRTQVRIYTFPSSIPYRACQVCEKPIRLHPSWKARNYCSRKCCSIAHQERTLVACAHCGKENEYIQAELKRAGAKYCDVECKRLATTIELNCSECQKPYRRPKSLVRTGTRNYCSEVCMKAYFHRLRTKRAYGVCAECGGTTSKKSYVRCRACSVGTFRNADGAGGWRKVQILSV